MSLQYKPATARRWLKKADPVMADLILRVGPFRMQTEFDLSPFEALLRAIIYQQLNGKSANAIHSRIQSLFCGEITAEALHAMSAVTLSAAGLSRAKVLAVQDLALKQLDGTIPAVAQLQSLTNEAIVELLTQVRGVGRWTVEVMLIFRLGRADVLPITDLGIRKGYQLAYGTENLPTFSELSDAGLLWAPYRSVASWYLWRATDSVDWVN